MSRPGADENCSRCSAQFGNRWCKVSNFVFTNENAIEHLNKN